MKTAIIVAAGKSVRMKSEESKAFLTLCGKPLLAWSLLAFEASKVDNIVIVTAAADIAKVKKITESYSILKTMAIIPGGEERQDSVANGLMFLHEKTKVVAVHDGARALITAELINYIFDNLNENDSVIPGINVIDTIKKVENEVVRETYKRADLRAIQTPQVFHKLPLVDSYKKASRENYYATDDAALLEKYGYNIAVCEGSCDNIKITSPIDMIIAETLLSNKFLEKDEDKKKI